MDYSPVEGLLHKYEMGLMYVVSTCSATAASATAKS